METMFKEDNDEIVELIKFRIKEAFASCDWNTNYPKYQDMQSALFDIESIVYSRFKPQVEIKKLT